MPPLDQQQAWPLSALSPIAGLGVEMALAWRFGASGIVDAFRIAALMIIFGQQLLRRRLGRSEWRSRGYSRLASSVTVAFGSSQAVSRHGESCL